MLTYLPLDEFKRILSLDCAPELRAAIFADACRINTLYMIARAGSGHIGSSFSSLEIVAWLFLEEMRRKADDGYQDIYFSSKGHDVPGLYAALSGLGIIDFKAIHQLRRLGGLPGHPDVATPGIAANTGSLGMGISKAKGMALANRLAGVDARIYILTGDGELQEGQVWESLISAANLGLFELTVIVDHNKLQSDIWVAQTSNLGDLEAKFRAFGWQVQRVDGHDCGSLAAALLDRDRSRPRVIIADTIKGQGVSFMQHRVPAQDRSLYPFHSGAPAPEVYNRALKEISLRMAAHFQRLGLQTPVYAQAPRISIPVLKQPQHLPSAYARELVAQGEECKELVVLDADLKRDCGLIPFEERFPDRFFECGIAEQDMVSMAGGMALKGLVPVVHSFACFLSTRANEQIYNNASERRKIIYAGFLAGILPGGPGHSHQSVRDISALGAIPGLVMVQPGCEEEVGLALDWSVNHAGESTYLRLTQIPCELSFQLPRDYLFARGRGAVIRPGADAAFITYGPVMLEQAWRAAGLLQANGLSVRVADLPWLNLVDLDWLRDVVAGCRALFTLDDHYLMGGQGEMLAATLAELDLGIPVHRLGIIGLPACGNNDEVLRHHGLDAESLRGFVLAHWR